MPPARARGDKIPSPEPPKAITDQRKPEEDQGNGCDMKDALKAWSDASEGKQPVVRSRRDDDQAPLIPLKRPKESDGQDLGKALTEWREAAKAK
jgi:hypothetical protein